MDNPLLISFLFLVLGLILGYVVGMWRQRIKLGSDFLSREDIAKQYTSTEVYSHLQDQADLQREDLQEKDLEIRQLLATLAGKEQKLAQLDEKLENQAVEVHKLQQQARVEFENVANRLLEEKSKQFKVQNQQELDHILKPLREKNHQF